MRCTHVEAPRFDTTTWIQQENIWLRLPRESWRYLFEHVKIKGRVAVFVLCSAYVRFYLPGGRWLNVWFLWQRWSHLPFTHEIKTASMYCFNTCLSHFPPRWMPFLLFWSVMRLYYNICALCFSLSSGYGDGVAGTVRLCHHQQRRVHWSHHHS